MNECWCFQTRADAIAASPAIPPGTPVTIEQYDTNSAVSHAVYIQYLGTGGAPGHALSFENNGNWWVIHPDYLTLEAAGAPPAGGDCAPAMDRVLVYLVAATRATLQLGTRDYILTYAATLTQSNPATDPLLYFSIVGQGPRVSRLLIPCVTDPIKPLGAFAITFSSNESGFEAREFSVIATGATTYGRGCGTAILVHFPGLFGADPSPGNHRGALVSHVEIGNDLLNGVSWSYFANGLDLTGAGNLLISDVGVTGPFVGFMTNNCGSRGTGDFSDESPGYLPTCHVVIDGCYGPTITALRLANAQIGIRHVTTGLPPGGDQGPQGFYMSKVDATGVKTGFLQGQTDTNGNSVECPVGMIENCYFEFRDVGLDLSDIARWHVRGCDFYNHCNGVNVGGDCLEAIAYDIHLRNAGVVNVMGCRFNMPGSPNRVHIFVDADDPAGKGAAQNVLIGQNQFGASVTGIYGISAIKVSPSAMSVVIGVNAYIGQYTGSIVDDRTSSGQAFSPLGFPSTSTTNLPSVLPSAYPANTSPSLGRAGPNGAWPNNFTLLQTIPISSEPSAPASGWVLYSVLGKLYALYQDGTKIPIAST